MIVFWKNRTSNNHETIIWHWWMHTVITKNLHKVILYRNIDWVRFHKWFTRSCKQYFIYQNEPLLAEFSDFRSQRDQSVRTHKWRASGTPCPDPFVFLFPWKWFQLVSQIPTHITNAIKQGKPHWDLPVMQQRKVIFDDTSVNHHQ